MRKSLLIVYCVLLIALFSISANSTVLRVGAGEELTTIQAGLDAVTLADDTVLVTPGLYQGTGNRELTFPLIKMHLVSEAGRNNTFIDCQGNAEYSYRAINMDNYNTINGTTIDGFTFRNGYKAYNSGGSISIYSVDVIIKNCIFENNFGGAISAYSCNTDIADCIFKNNTMIDGGEVSGEGGAIQLLYSEGLITNCTFEDNHGEQRGGAVYLYESSPTISGCSFISNHSELGGAIFMQFYSVPSISGCTFVGNYATVLGGTFYINTSGGESSEDPSRNIPAKAQSFGAMSACLITGTVSGGAFYIVRSYGMGISCTNIYGNTGGDWTDSIAVFAGTGGNISVDPLYCNPASGDYGLTGNSPCAAANNSCGRLIGAHDVNCEPVTIELDQTEVAFVASYAGGNPASQIISITNGGGATLPWNVANLSSWLTVSPINGTAPTSITLTVDKTSFVGGIYYDTVTIFSENAENSPRILPISLTVTSEEPQFGSIITEAPVIIGDTTRIVAHTVETFRIDFSVTDIDSDSLVLFADTKPSLATFTDNGDGSASFLWDPVTATSGQYDLIIGASDESQTVYQAYLIDINQPPTFTDTCSGLVFVENQTTRCNIVAIDAANPVGYTTTFDWNSVPATATFVENSDLTASFEFTPTPADVGQEYIAVFTLDDSFRQQTYSLVINVVNNPLQVVSITPDPDAAGDILVNEKIQIIFSEAIDQATLSTGISVITAQGHSLTKAYDANELTVTISNGSSNLPVLDTIEIVVNYDLLDVAGQPLAEIVLANYITGDVIYPGDANSDGVVDERDLLPMGLHWGNTGPARAVSPDFTWVLTPVRLDDGASQWHPAAGIHADADGNGVVAANDICSIYENWSLTHAVSSKEAQTSLAQALLAVDEDVRAQMLAAAIDCPAAVGINQVSELLESSLGDVEPLLPDKPELYGNYPNPFNPSTTISYFVAANSLVTLQVYNLLGQEVTTLINENQESGYHQVEWNGCSPSGQTVSSGVYFYRMSVGDVQFTRRMLLLK